MIKYSISNLVSRVIMDEDLPAQLRQFLKIVDIKLKDYEETGRIKRDKVAYYVTKISNFKMNKYELNYSSHSNVEVKEQWNDKSKIEMIEDIKSLNEYSSLVTHISNDFGLNNQQVEYNFSRFIDRFINILIKKEITENLIIDVITTFMGDLDGHSIKWDIKVWIKGLWLESEYEIYKSLKIRPILPKDLEDEIPFYLIGSPSPHNKSESRAVLEFSIKSRDEAQLRNEIQLIITCLRLFRLGSVDDEYTEFEPKSFLETPYGSGRISRDLSPIYKYQLREEDIPKLLDLISRIKKLNNKDLLIEGMPKFPQSIALQRYNDSLLHHENIESRVTTAINSLEAIYLKKDERAELSHRLGQRASILLGFYEIPTLKTYNDLHRAYAIRSNYIHGSYDETEAKSKSVYDLTQRVVDYARISILIYLQLMGKVEKDALISKIDNSLLNIEARGKLKEIVTKNCVVYK